MNLEEMFEDFRVQFTEISAAADKKHIEMWDTVDENTRNVWFESLANVANLRMGDKDHQTQLQDIFQYFALKYRQEGEDIKNCIDVCFVENLFWQVPPRRAASSWDQLPDVLQRLYIDFHKRPPRMLR